MFGIIGVVIVFGCVIGGYMAMGGKLGVLMQPFELVIIGGAAIGTFVLGNSMKVVKAAGAGFGLAFKGSKYKRDDYLELLSMLYSVFKLAKTKGMLALEQHVENPHESALFNQFPKFSADHHAVEFLCDYLRLLTMGSENPHELESLLDEELETHHNEDHAVSSAIQTMADACPALGIVAAVLGVIKTMAAINEPPAVLGGLIGAALVGTFLGILISYGFFGPIANRVKEVNEADAKYLQAIKAGLVAHLQGYAPAVSVEFARKVLFSDVRPTFLEVEEATGKLLPV
jgi:chemotaxis protein MotA